jgi:hypothetical protein
VTKTPLRNIGITVVFTVSTLHFEHTCDSFFQKQITAILLQSRI